MKRKQRIKIFHTPLSRVYEGMVNEQQEEPNPDDVQMYAKEPQHDEPEFIGNIKYTDFEKLRRQIVSKSRGGSSEMVLRLLELGDWHQVKNAEDFMIEIYQKAIDYILDAQVNEKGLGEHIAKKEAGKLTSIDKYITTGGRFNLLRTFDPEIKSLFKNTGEFIRRAFKHTFSIDRVATGPGEVAISLLSNGKKGKVGDIVIPGVGEVEVKGAAGRIGKGD